jgi:hypothetical protein
LPYLVKWKMTTSGRTLESPTPFLTPALAVDFACSVMTQHPSDIWIEGPGAIRIERKMILRSCQDQGPPPPQRAATAAGPRGTDRAP